MNAKALFLVLFLSVVASCSEVNNANKRNLCYSDFENNLKIEMDYTAIVAKFGAPLRDIGSGIHIYVYQLVDSTEVWIGYTDRILYAKHMDRSQQVITTFLSI